MSLMALLALGAACRTEPLRAPAPGAGPVVTVLTYNVNFERFDPVTVDTILEADADVVFLQETTTAWEDEIRGRLAERYPAMIFHPYEPDGGMAVLTSGPLSVHQRLDSPVGAFPATCLTVGTAIGPLRTLHVHLHPPLDEGGLLTGYFTTGGARKAEMEAYIGCFGAPPDLALGDFNEGEGEALGIVEAHGLRDAASTFPPVGPTWRWDSPVGELTGRPDHVFYGPELTVSDVRVIEAGASDHRPLRVELQRPEAP